MSTDRKLGLDDAYAVETPEDNIRLYADWAATYESGFVTSSGYVAYLRVVEHLAKRLRQPGSEIVDIGCGTGVCGQALASFGFNTIDGIDISNEMLAEAAQKIRDDGRPVYRRLIHADLTKPVSVADGKYAGLVSAGTFTHGHLGPKSLDALWSMVVAGGLCSIGINANHYEDAGFAAKIAAADKDKLISLLEVVDIATYKSPPPDVTPGNDRTKVLVCRVNR